MRNTISAINQILADWDSLGIGNPQIAADEYQGYIPGVIKHRNNRANLITYLEECFDR